MCTTLLAPKKQFFVKILPGLFSRNQMFMGLQFIKFIYTLDCYFELTDPEARTQYLHTERAVNSWQVVSHCQPAYNAFHAVVLVVVDCHYNNTVLRIAHFYIHTFLSTKMEHVCSLKWKGDWINPVSYTHLDVYKRQICVVCFNEVVCEGRFCSGVECFCVFNVSLLEATSCLAYVEFTAI